MTPRAFLDVEASLSGRRWVGPGEALTRQAELLAQQTGLSLALCAILARQGVDAATAPAYLAPAIRELLPDPLRLRDMDLAAGIFVAAITGGQRIAVFADYDVDGGSSAALIIDWLRQMGRTAELYIPDRIEEGYGPNVPAMQQLAARNDLIICVDCGTLSHEAIAAAKGAAVLVLDHHIGGETLPPAQAVVNPNRQDEPGDLGHLCAAGVVFLFLVEVNRRMKAGGHDALPPLMEMLDLVALAVIADVAPLVGVNRAFVRQGLRIMAQRHRPGLVALADEAGIDAAPSAYHLGFVLGPRINAGGRVGRADLGARLLLAAEIEEARSLAARLGELNAERREIEAAVLASAMAQVEARGGAGPLVWAAGEGWHPGVVGIVAARLKEATHRPAVVIGFDGDEGKGSGRSVAGIDLGAAVHRLAAEGLVTRGGGHKMAAGLSLDRASLEAAMARLGELVARQGEIAAGPRDLMLDGLLVPGAAQAGLVEEIESAGPFGQGAPAPRYAFADQPIRQARLVGANHVKLSFGDRPGPTIEAIGFNIADAPLGRALLAHGGARFHLAGHVGISVWNGRSRVELRLDDAARAG